MPIKPYFSALIFALILVTTMVARAETLQCEAVVLDPSAVFEWHKHSYILPFAGARSLTTSSEERMQILGMRPIKVLKTSPLKDVYLVEWHGQQKVAKFYKGTTLDKLNRVLQRDKLLGEILPTFNQAGDPVPFATETLQII